MGTNFTEEQLRELAERGATEMEGASAVDILRWTDEHFRGADGPRGWANCQYLVACTMQDAVTVSLLPSRMATEALGVMGLLAALLAVTGIFGMASYSVSRRMKEQGIRMALGAQRRQVMESILRRPVLLLMVGSGIGMGAGIAASQVMAYLISFATPRDPVVLGFVLLAMLLVGVVATWIPARRAMRIDPARLLRE